MGSPKRFVARLPLAVVVLCATTALSEGGRLSADQFGLLAERLRESSSFKVRLQAALLLGTAGGPDAEPLLVSTLREDKNQAVRAAAALALGQTQDERALDPLVLALSDNEALLRSQAEKGLAQLAQTLPDGASKVWESLGRGSENAQVLGLTVLGTLGAGGVPGLCAALVLGSEVAKSAAKGELSRLSSDQLNAGLRAALRRKDSDISPLAAAMIGDRGDPTSLVVLADAMSDPTQPSAVQSEAHSALVRLSGAITPDVENRRFESDDPQDRMRAVVLLAIRGGPAAEALGLRALKDPNLRVQAAGASALADMGATAALPQLHALLNREEETPILHVLQIATRRLERKPSK